VADHRPARHDVGDQQRQQPPSVAVAVASRKVFLSAGMVELSSPEGEDHVVQGEGLGRDELRGDAREGGVEQRRVGQEERHGEHQQRQRRRRPAPAPSRISRGAPYLPPSTA
jgi:hypothetical protein